MAEEVSGVKIMALGKTNIEDSCVGSHLGSSDLVLDHSGTSYKFADCNNDFRDN